MRAAGDSVYEEWLERFICSSSKLFELTREGTKGVRGEPIESAMRF